LTAPPLGQAAGAEKTIGRTAGKLFEEWQSAGKAATRPNDDEPEPKPQRQKEKGEGRGAFIAARSIIKRGVARTAQLAADAFANAARAMTAPELPDWLREFFEIDSDPDNPLDLSNPDRDLVLGAGDIAAFDAGYIEASGPSLDLG
jgi:hypothetical protein